MSSTKSLRATKNKKWQAQSESTKTAALASKSAVLNEALLSGIPLRPVPKGPWLEHTARDESRCRYTESRYEDVLKAFSVNLSPEELIKTADRHVAFLGEALTFKHFDFTVFPSHGAKNMVIQAPIPFFSLCEHHVLPFVGSAAVAYIPNGWIAGLSKLARSVDFCSRGLNTQEAITQRLLEFLCEKLSTKDVAVTMRAMHLCMSIRGVKAADVYTTTAAYAGEFSHNISTRSEFLALANPSLMQ